MIYQLKRNQIIPASLEEVWGYFSRPENLNEITPPDLKFQILFGGDQPMYQGQLMAYKIQLFPLIRTTWLTEITQVQEPTYFADQQRLGPYRFWLHEHTFQVSEGGVEMRDLVTYQLPLGPLGRLTHFLLVGPRLKDIFDFRAKKVAKIFNP
jgi:ligand-binding SRPBCC domain-containing protein